MRDLSDVHHASSTRSCTRQVPKFHNKKRNKKRGVTGAVERQWKAERRYGWIEEGVREERERERKNERGIGREGERGRREYGEREC